MTTQLSNPAGRTSTHNNFLSLGYAQKDVSVDSADQSLHVPDFDPLIHLNFQPPTARYTFTELGLPVPYGIPDLCYTEPFQLFSEEGVRMIRREVFNRAFLDKYMRSWERSPCVITGHVHHKTDGKFMKQAMRHPVTRAAVNVAFGCELRLQDAINDLGYINVQLGSEGFDAVYNLTETPSKPLPADQKLEASRYDDDHIDSWHLDQTPVVLVLMLSDTSTMIGGETAVRMGDGTIIKSRGANIGGAVMMAGGYLEHAALRATNCAERLSLVNSYSYADPNADDTATNFRGIHYGIDSFADYKSILLAQKLERLRGRCDIAMKQARERFEKGEDVSREEVESWVKDQILLLKQTSWEMFERVPEYLHKEAPAGILDSYLA